MNSTLPTESQLEQQLRRLLPAPTPGDHAPVDLIYLLASSGHSATKQIPGHSLVDGAPEARD